MEKLKNIYTRKHTQKHTHTSTKMNYKFMICISRIVIPSSSNYNLVNKSINSTRNNKILVTTFTVFWLLSWLCNHSKLYAILSHQNHQSVYKYRLLNKYMFCSFCSKVCTKQCRIYSHIKILYILFVQVLVVLKYSINVQISYVSHAPITPIQYKKRVYNTMSF